MTSQDDPLRPLRAAIAAITAARQDRLTPVRVHNRLMTAARKECDLLAATEQGRAALTEAAAADNDPLVRIKAATTIQRWDVEGARTALEDLVRSSGGEVARPMTMTSACAVRNEPGFTAALCLLNLDRPQPLPASRPTLDVQARVPSRLLDAAERVYGLAMNGGLDHAYEAAGDQFLDAAAACDAVAALECGDALREFVALVPGSHNLDTRRGRAEALSSFNATQVQQLQSLSARFTDVGDLIERLEVATEA